MEDKVLNILTNENKALSVYEIKDLLGITDVEDIKELIKILNKLENEFKICYTKKNKYMILKNSNLRVGNLQVTKKVSDLLKYKMKKIFLFLLII